MYEYFALTTMTMTLAMVYYLMGIRTGKLILTVEQRDARIKELETKVVNLSKRSF